MKCFALPSSDLRRQSSELVENNSGSIFYCFIKFGLLFRHCGYPPLSWLKPRPTKRACEIQSVQKMGCSPGGRFRYAAPRLSDRMARIDHAMRFMP